VEFVNVILEKFKQTQNGFSYREKLTGTMYVISSPVKLNKQLELFLLDSFDTEPGRFMFNGLPIDIKPLVPKVIGLPQF
jgi:hypothetical protein